MAQPMTYSNSAPSLDVVFDYVKIYSESQDTQISALDSKAGFVLGSASLLTTGVSVFQSSSLSASAQLVIRGIIPVWSYWLVFSLLCLALITYALSVLTAYQAYKVQGYSTISEIKLLRDKYIDEAPDVTKQALLDTMVEAVEINKVKVENKAVWTKRSLVLLGVEAVFVAILISVQLAIQNL